MLEKFGGEAVSFTNCKRYFEQLFYSDFLNIAYVNAADISKAMQAKRKRLEVFTKSSLKGSNQKIEQLWKTQHSQR